MKKIFSIILASIAMTSCVDTVILPDNKTVDDDYWQKKTEVDNIVSAAYAQLRDASALRNMIVWGDFRSDELLITSNVPSNSTYYNDLQQIYSQNIVSENAFTTWYPFYSAINYCNLVLEKAEGVVAVDPDYTQGDYDANKAQVLALRAMCYFYLMRVFHDIPVTPGAYLNSSDDLNAPQKTPAEVLDMCINDLNEALKYAIPGNTYGDWRDKGYLNQDGINALLADVYLWRASVNRDAADYQACVDCCDKVIKAKKEAYEQSFEFRRLGTDAVKQDYYLEPLKEAQNPSGGMYNLLFGLNTEYACESIFELQINLTGNGSNTGVDQMYYRYNSNAKNGYGYLKASSYFGLASETAGKSAWTNSVDQRLFEYVYDANNSVDQYSVRKYIASSSVGGVKAEANPAGERKNSMAKNWIFYRLTDVMLMKAEALVQLYELAGKDPTDTRNQDAFNIVKFVNDRAITDVSKALSFNTYKDRMEELVLAERARELCFEGKRWYDLMRYNYRHTATKANPAKKLNEGYVTNYKGFYDLALRKYTVPDAMKAKIKDERYLYMPINQNEIDINSNLVQNSAYKSTKSKN
jgi:hypothetical protein